MRHGGGHPPDELAELKGALKMEKTVLEQKENITVLNPGSLSYPRQDGRKPSYMLMEIDRNGEAHYTLNYL